MFVLLKKIHLLSNLTHVPFNCWWGWFFSFFFLHFFFTFYVYVFFPLLNLLWTWLYIWTTLRVFYKKQKQLTLREYVSSPQFLLGSLLLIFSVFLYRTIMFLFVLNSVAWWPFQLFVGGLMSFLYYLCLYAYCCVQHLLCFFFWVFFFFTSSCVPYVASFSGLSIFGCPFGIL